MHALSSIITSFVPSFYKSIFICFSSNRVSRSSGCSPWDSNSDGWIIRVWVRFSVMTLVEIKWVWLGRYLWNDMALWGASGLSAHEDTVVRVATLTGSLQLLLKGTQPLGHQVNVLWEKKMEQFIGYTRNFCHLVFSLFKDLSQKIRTKRSGRGQFYSKSNSPPVGSSNTKPF